MLKIDFEVVVYMISSKWTYGLSKDLTEIFYLTPHC